MDNDGIRFELRKRSQQKTQDLWAIYYDVNTGTILNIQPKKENVSNSLTVTYVKIKKILSGQANQNDYKIQFNEKIGALDLVNIRKPAEYKKKRQTWYSWLSQTASNKRNYADISVTLFNEQGFLRVECSREWGQRHRESPMFKEFDLYITDSEDPHQLFGFIKIPLHALVERGFYESRLWSFMDHKLVAAILYQGQNIRINIPPVVETVNFVRLKDYFPFSGIVDDQTTLSHPGPGKHVSIFLKDNTVWAKSHYTPGSALDNIKGNIRAALIWQDDPDNFLGWVEFPALLLRENIPFELVKDWQAKTPPNLLYKANNIDIGVILNENTYQ